MKLGPAILCVLLMGAAIAALTRNMDMDEESYEAVFTIDKALAKGYGWSGLYTISAELEFARTRPQRVFKWALNKIDPGHTARAAQSEGLQ